VAAIAKDTKQRQEHSCGVRLTAGGVIRSGAAGGYCRRYDLLLEPQAATRYDLFDRRWLLPQVAICLSRRWPLPQ
jgi:hypothetical protein